MSKHLEVLHRRHAQGERQVNINQVHDDSLTIGQKIADAVASGMGSWPFIIIQSAIVLGWIGGNLWLLSHPYDPYPFILLNLLFSTQAAYAAPVIMMSQNRQSAKDRLTAEEDYHVNQASKQEIETILNRLDKQDEKILEVDSKILQVDEKILGIATDTRTILQQVEARKSQKKSPV